MIYIKRKPVLKTLLPLVVVLVVVKIQPSTFSYDPRLYTLTLDFLRSPPTFYRHPRHWTLTLDIGPSTLDPRQKPKLAWAVVRCL